MLLVLLSTQVASMGGSALAGRLLAPQLNIKVERYMQVGLWVSRPLLRLAPSGAALVVVSQWL